MADMVAPAVAEPARPGATRRERRGWYFYDWANSAFQTTVITVFLGPFLTTVTELAASSAPTSATGTCTRWASGSPPAPTTRT
jgi:MFS-type transporter involved in bile tolerance (Atg22 family)